MRRHDPVIRRVLTLLLAVLALTAAAPEQPDRPTAPEPPDRPTAPRSLPGDPSDLPGDAVDLPGDSRSLPGDSRGLPTAPRSLPDPRVYGALVYEGPGFDTCLAPPLSTMRAWRSSPYGAVGVYFGGHGRGCPWQPHLTPDWMLAVHEMGWRVLPLYVGSQSPCVIADHKWRYRLQGDPVAAGIREGRDAVARARELGMAERSALYLDLEGFSPVDGECGRTTLEFVRAWSTEVRRRGWFPGLYSSADSGVRLVERARRDGVTGLPSVVWFARWSPGRPELAHEPVLAPSAWQPHRRIHQYAGEVVEMYGGVALAVDRNAVDAPVAVLEGEQAPTAAMEPPE